MRVLAQMEPAPAVAEDGAEGGLGSRYVQLSGHISLGKCLLTPAADLPKQFRI